MTDCYSLMAFQCVNKSVLQLLIRKKALRCATASKVTHKQLTEYTNLEQGLSSTHNKAFLQWCTRYLVGSDQTPELWEGNGVTAGLGIFNDWQCTQCAQQCPAASVPCGNDTLAGLAKQSTCNSRQMLHRACAVQSHQMLTLTRTPTEGLSANLRMAMSLMAPVSACSNMRYIVRVFCHQVTACI